MRLDPLVDTRLRYEQVEQAPLLRDADAVTARMRSGIEAQPNDFTLLVESEASLAIGENCNSGLNGRTGFPSVAEPQIIGLNRLQLQYRGVPSAKIGRFPALAKYADEAARSFATDTSKFRLSLEWTP